MSEPRAVLGALLRSHLDHLSPYAYRPHLAWEGAGIVKDAQSDATRRARREATERPERP